MDFLGVSMKGGKRSHTKSSTKKAIKVKAIKVVYISSPMKVKTSASEFRALVQELTGKDSDAERFLDINGARNSPETPHQTAEYDHHASMFPLTNSCRDESPSTTSSESFLESLDGELFPSMEGSFMGMLQSSLFHESFQLDVLN